MIISFLAHFSANSFINEVIRMYNFANFIPIDTTESYNSQSWQMQDHK